MHTQIRIQEQSENCLNCLIFDLHSDMYMYALIKHADHFLRQLCQFRPDRCRLKDETFERLMAMCNNQVCSPVVKDNKNIRNNTILKQNRTVLKLIT